MKEEKFDFEAFKKEAMNKLKNKEPGAYPNFSLF